MQTRPMDTHGKAQSDFSRNVRARRRALGLTQAQVAARMGWYPHRISQIEHGVFPSDPARIMALARALETSVEALLGARGRRAADVLAGVQVREPDVPHPGTRAVPGALPVVGHAAADESGGRVTFEEEVSGEYVVIDADTVAVRVEGASMEPVALDGQSVFARRRDHPGEVPDGALAIVELADEGGILFKRVYRREDGFQLCSVNPLLSIAPRHVSADAIRRVYQVVGVWFDPPTVVATDDLPTGHPLARGAPEG